MKNKMMIVLLAVLTLFSGSFAYANSPDESMMGKSREGGMAHRGQMNKDEMQCPVAEKFMKKSSFLLEKQTELGLTEEQVKTIKDLKLEVEKSGIRQKAEMEVFMLDVKSKLDEEKINVEEADALIDKGFASMAQSTKASVASYAKLKSTLTAEQSAKMKELFKSERASWKDRESK